MIVKVQGKEFTVSDALVKLSPFLHTISMTKNTIDTDGDAIVVGDDDPMFRYFDLYLEYLRGSYLLDHLNGRSMDGVYFLLIELLDFMGHGNEDILNPLKYPPNIWAVKVHDDWVRDNFYPQSLYDDPLYDLVEVTIVEERAAQIDKIMRVKNGSLALCPNIFIAGGFAMWLAGWTDAYKDIDIFFTDKNALINVLHLYEKAISVAKIVNEQYMYTHSRYRRHTRAFPIWKNSVNITRKVQGILRLYRCPSEIVHGFDLDCCGILYDPREKRLWATRRAIWANENHMNIFDPMRASPSYAYRLSKYRIRGYDIFLPLFGDENLNTNALEEWKDNMRKEYYDHIADKEHEEAVKFPDEHRDLLPENVHGDVFVTTWVTKGIRTVNKEHPWSQMGRFIGFKGSKLPQDMLVLAKYLHYHPCMRKEPSDYANKDEQDEAENLSDRSIVLEDDTLYVPDLAWKEQDPGTQITSTFFPEPIQDMIVWWKTSKFFRAEHTY